MTFLMILLALSVLAIGMTVRDVFLDGGTATRPAPRSHAEDPQFRSPAHV